MNKNTWLIPFFIVAINAIVIIIRWTSLPELLPAHYDLQGNASGTMPIFMIAEPIILLATVIGFVFAPLNFTNSRCYLLLLDFHSYISTSYSIYAHNSLL